MNSSLSTTERCRSILNHWREHLSLTNLELVQLKQDLYHLDHKLKNLTNRKFQISVFGRVGVGKSSLLNALLQKQIFNTDVTHGSTKRAQVDIWNHPFSKLKYIEVIDSPGIDEINASKSRTLIPKESQQADLILFVLDSDLTSVELTALKTLLHSGKPIILILNRCDQWTLTEVSQLKKTIRNRLPLGAKGLQIHAISAAPRKSNILPNGKVRSEPIAANIDSLKESLIDLLNEQGELLLALNSLRQADDFYNTLRQERLKRNKAAAQTLIGKFAALKASSVAASPLLMLDLTTGLACDTALIVSLSKLYGLQIQGTAARALLKRLSIYNALLGGTQVSIQVLLSVLRHVFFIAAPFTGGLSLISTAPIALAQAAFAVHTTKLTGRLAAKEFLVGSHLGSIQPRSMLRRLAKKDSEIQLVLNTWPNSIEVTKSHKQIKALLP